MLTLRKIIAATYRTTKQRARSQCYGIAYAPPRSANKKTISKGGGFIGGDEKTGKYREFKYRVRCQNEWHQAVVRFHGPLNLDTKVWCWCSCDNFKFTSEVALAKKGSSTIVQSNGAPPKITNPKREPRVCKHLVLVFALALRRRKPGRDTETTTKTRPTAAVPKRASQRSIWIGDRKL